MAEEIHLGSGDVTRSMNRLAKSAADLFLVHSPSRMVTDASLLRRSISGRPIIFWEGDAWGRRKPLPLIYGAWLESAVAVFCVGGPPQTRLFEQLGAPEPQPIVSTYDQVVFAPLSEWSGAQASPTVTFLGNNLSRAGVGGLPGSRQRWKLVRTLRNRLSERAVIRGQGWPRRWGIEPAKYSSQGQLTRESVLSVAWDHYPDTVASTSDRTPITMLAGRVLVLNAKPAHDRWLPLDNNWILLADTPVEAVDIVEELLGQSNSSLLERGRELHLWAKDRLSHHQAVRHMLSRVLPEVEPPGMTPWKDMPGLWR